MATREHIAQIVDDSNGIKGIELATKIAMVRTVPAN